MNKSKIQIIIGIILIFLCVSFILSNSSVLFNSNSGKIYFEFQEDSPVDIDNMKNYINKITALDEDKILIERDENILLIELSSGESELGDILFEKVSDDYNNSLIFLGRASTGPVEKTFAYYLIILILVISLIGGVTIFFRGIIQLKNRKNIIEDK